MHKYINLIKSQRLRLLGHEDRVTSEKQVKQIKKKYN